MEFCRKLGEPESILNAIGGHHNDIPSTTPYTPIVMAADAISGARPGARRAKIPRCGARITFMGGHMKSWMWKRRFGMRRRRCR
jgi:ribonuclease Y